MPGDLEGLARDFSGRIQRVLNTTLCTGIKMSTLVSADRKVVNVGYGLSKTQVTTLPIPVRRGTRRPRCWLDVQYRLKLDEEATYLMVHSSFFGLYGDAETAMCLCHFDYERNKSDGYPEAHLQVDGESAALAGWTGSPRTKELGRLHFPAGNRRYRTILEDVIEFMIVERLADPCEGWEQVIARERQEFQRLQLRAAIRRDPETAREMVRELDV